jgi:6-phosphogluconolactonase (cycloisomerase 2 family)
LSQDSRWLFAVNAGSDEVSIFAVQPQGLVLVDKIASGGDMPISLTTYKNLLYVLNAGGSGNISGFMIGNDGRLAPIPGSTQLLSNGGVGAAPGPAQVSFNPDGNILVVTEKASNVIDVYTVSSTGTASGPVVNPSAGATPFGFGFGHNGVLIVSEAFGGAPDASATSSYQLAGTSLQVVSASAQTHQTAACWIAVTQNGKFAYAANAGSGSVSGYQVGQDGSLTLLDADGRTGVTGPGSTPVDMAMSHNSQYLYVLGNGSHMIHAFSVNADGSLGTVAGAAVPGGAAGIAAW